MFGPSSGISRWTRADGKLETVIERHAAHLMAHGLSRKVASPPDSEHLFQLSDEIENMEVYAGDQVDRVLIVTHNVKFDSGRNPGGSRYSIDVGSGLLFGFRGTSDGNAIYSLGATFSH